MHNLKAIKPKLLIEFHVNRNTKHLYSRKSSVHRITSNSLIAISRLVEMKTWNLFESSMNSNSIVWKMPLSIELAASKSASFKWVDFILCSRNSIALNMNMSVLLAEARSNSIEITWHCTLVSNNYCHLFSHMSLEFNWFTSKSNWKYTYNHRRNSKKKRTKKKKKRNAHHRIHGFDSSDFKWFLDLIQFWTLRFYVFHLRHCLLLSTHSRDVNLIRHKTRKKFNLTIERRIEICAICEWNERMRE